MTEPLDPLPDTDADQPVPLFRTWTRAYLFVVGIFLLQVIAYSLLTWACA